MDYSWELMIISERAKSRRRYPLNQRLIDRFFTTYITIEIIRCGVESSTCSNHNHHLVPPLQTGSLCRSDLFEGFHFELLCRSNQALWYALHRWENTITFSVSCDTSCYWTGLQVAASKINNNLKCSTQVQWVVRSKHGGHRKCFWAWMKSPC